TLNSPSCSSLPSGSDTGISEVIRELAEESDSAQSFHRRRISISKDHRKLPNVAACQKDHTRLADVLLARADVISGGRHIWSESDSLVRDLGRCARSPWRGDRQSKRRVQFYKDRKRQIRDRGAARWLQAEHIRACSRGEGASST